MQNFNLFAAVALAGGVLLAVAPAAHADPITPYVVTLTQQGGNVVANGTGAIDLTGLAFVTSASTASSGGGVFPGDAEVVIGLSTIPFDEYTATLSGPANFGSGDATLSSSASGGVVGSYINEGFVVAPDGYISLSLLSNSATFDDATLSSLGITPGTYTWTWGAGAEQSITLQAGVTTPEPSSLLLLLSGLLAGLGLFRKQLFGASDC